MLVLCICEVHSGGQAIAIRFYGPPEPLGRPTRTPREALPDPSQTLQGHKQEIELLHVMKGAFARYEGKTLYTRPLKGYVRPKNVFLWKF